MSSLKTSLLICAIAIPFVACELAGEQTPASATRSPIIGGTAVNDGSWPAVGAVTLEPDSMCTGTLIAPKVVVTAAHCVKGENPTKFTLGYDMDNGTDYTVHGRIRDALTATDGRRVTTWQVDQCFAGVEGIVHYQLRQTAPDQFQLRYIPEVEVVASEPLSGLVAKLESLLGASMTVAAVPTLLPEASGKFRLTCQANASS